MTQRVSAGLLRRYGQRCCSENSRAAFRYANATAPRIRGENVEVPQSSRAARERNRPTASFSSVGARRWRQDTYRSSRTTSPRTSSGPPGVARGTPRTPSRRSSRAATRRRRGITRLRAKKTSSTSAGMQLWSPGERLRG